MHITAKVETITAKQAERWLAEADPNRKVRSTLVDRYARDMGNGRWLFTGAPIVLDEEGKLLDGQHRLMAVIASGAELTAVVVRGVPKENVVAIDLGTKRSLADMLHFRGVTQTTGTSAVVRAVASWHRHDVPAEPNVWNKYTLAVSTGEALEIYEAHRERFDETVHHVARLGLAKSPYLAGFRTPGLLIYERPEQAVQFYEAVVDPYDDKGQGLVRGHPAGALRDWLLSGYADSVRMSPSTRLAHHIKAFNMWMYGEKVTGQRLRWTAQGPTREAFPKIAD
jgi:hypothetical protein